MLKKVVGFINLKRKISILKFLYLPKKSTFFMVLIFFFMSNSSPIKKLKIIHKWREISLSQESSISPVKRLHWLSTIDRYYISA